VLAAVALLVYKLAEILLKRVLELRRLELDKSLESFKAELVRAAQAQYVTFTKLHQERFQAVLQLAKLLDSTDLAMRHLVAGLRSDSDPPHAEQAKQAAKAANEFLDYYYANLVMFDTQTCAMIDKIASKYKEAHVDMAFLALPIPQGVLATRGKTDYWREAESIVTKDIPPLTASLREHFRVLLGVAAGAPEGKRGTLL